MEYLWRDRAVGPLACLLVALGCITATPAYSNNCGGLGVVDPSSDAVLNLNGQSDCLAVPDGTVTLNGVLAAAAPLGSPSSATFVYDGTGRLIGDTGSNATTTTYDTQGQLVSVTGSGGTTNYIYNTTGQLSETTGPAGTTTYAYDSLGRLVSETGSGGTTSFTYNTTGQLFETTGPAGTTTYAYDPLGQLVSETGSGGTTSFTYNTTGQLFETTGPAGTTTYAFDPLGQLDSVTDPVGVTVLIYNNGFASPASESDPGMITFVDTVVTPTPAALPLFATGLGALGLFGWRRKRKNVTAVATA